MRVFIIVVILGWSLADCIAQEADFIVAPNVFTPNGDGTNDIFEVRSNEGKKVSLKIYTRAGVLIYAVEAERCRWDGNSLSGMKMSTGVYYYSAEIVGSTSRNARKSGFVHLYR